MCLRDSRKRRAGAATDPEIDGWVHVTPSPSEMPDDTPEWLLHAERLLKQVCGGPPSALFPAGLAPPAERSSVHGDLPGHGRRSRTASLLTMALVLIGAARLLQLALLHAVLDPTQQPVAPVHPSARQHALLHRPLSLVPAAEAAEEQAATVTLCVTVSPRGWWLGAAAAATAEEQAAAAARAAASTELQGARWSSHLALPAPPPPLPLLSLPPGAPWRPPRPLPASSGGG
eukprot:scaffold135565_cov105-Phaeocystis_antarctica.AAC.1